MSKTNMPLITQEYAFVFSYVKGISICFACLDPFLEVYMDKLMSLFSWTNLCRLDL